MTSAGVLAGVGAGAVASLTELAAPAAAATNASREALSIKDTSQSGYGPRAVGDGVADDTAAIQQHIFAAAYGAGGGVIFMPVGTYRVRSTITVPAGVSIVCGGNARIGNSDRWNAGVGGTTTLLAASGFGGTILATAGAGTTISNLRVAGGTASSDTPSVHVKPGTGWGRVRIEHCAFWRRGREVVLWDSTGEFVDNFVWGQSVAGCTGVTISAADSKFIGNEITAAGDCVQLSADATANIISNNTIFNSATGAGIHTYSARCVFSGNRIDENAGPGILVEGHGNVITGNAILLNGASSAYLGPRVGVHLLYGQGTTVSGNYFGNWCHGAICNTQQYAVAVTGSSANNAVVGNTFIDQAVGGVLYFSNGEGNVITGNAGQA